VISPGGVIIDTSVAIAIIRREPEGRDAVNAISRWIHDGDRLIVPSHFWLEVTNSLARRHRLTGAQVLEAVHLLYTFQLTTVDVDRPLVVLTIDLAKRHALSTYDAEFLALAISIDASLATFDRALGLAAGSRAIYPGQTRLSEVPTPYEHAVTWPSYRGASAYLAKLRAEAARPG
jgi:predicted nucleic acid-binding protein